MTASLLAASPGVDLLSDYDRFVDGLGIGPQARRLRRRAARRFVAAHPDLGQWMGRPTPARLVDVARADAWPFLSWCFIEGHVRPDVDLLGAKTMGALFTTWAATRRADVDRVVAAGRALGWADAWVHQVCVDTLALVCLTTGRDPAGLDDDVLTGFAADLDRAAAITANHRRVITSRLGALRLVCFQLGLVLAPPAHPSARNRTLADRVAAIAQPDIRRVALRYLEVVSATLRPSTIRSRADSLDLFAAWLAEHHPDVTSFAMLRRDHLEEFLGWNATRSWRGRVARDQVVSPAHAHHAIIDLKACFEDLALWGWAERPPAPVLHRSDIPRLPTPVPRALTPDADRDLMAAVANLDDIAARCAITILRGTGMRLGELLDLEIECLLDFASHGTWVKVPVGKLNTERTVPLDDATLAAFDQWMAQRGRQRALPHPRTGRPADFLFVLHGHRMGAARIRRGLRTAAAAAGMRSADGSVRNITPHQLRHTYATTLVNGGMSLQALMALLGHVTPEMTLRYAALASDTVRTAYDEAMNRARPKRNLLAAVNHRGVVPDRVEWLRSEMLKTRVAHGYCSRHLAADACPYANICEQCDNFVTTPEFRPALQAQLADIHALRDDADTRGWDTEVARHARVITSIESHLRRLAP